MQRESAPQAQPRPKRREDIREQLPPWQNTRPRGNPEADRQDVERSRERLEAVVGR